MSAVYDDGEFTWHRVDDGAIVAVNDDGQVVYAFDEGTEQPLDPSDYELAADPYAQQEQRLAELERRVAEPRPQAELRVTQQPPQVDLARLDQDMSRQRRDLERVIGRALTISEAREIGAAMIDDVEAGQRPDIWTAAERIGGLVDLDGGTRGQQHEQRTQYMLDRLADDERYAAHARGEDDLNDPIRPGSGEYFDLDDREQRQAYLTERMEGRAHEGQAYSSSDLPDLSEEP